MRRRGGAGHRRDDASPARSIWARLSSWLLAFLTLAALTPAGAAGPQALHAQSIPPHVAWYAFETDNFRVSYTEGLDIVARRAADRAERAYMLLAREFVRPPRGAIELLITDNVDVANGFAGPYPRNRIVVFANPPASERSLAFHDDWLHLVLLHELVHVFHLDNAGSIWSPLRQIFGRSILFFPQIFSPGWLIEGLAVHLESEHTGGGRVRGSFYEMMLRTAVLEGTFFPIDRATLDPVAWPGGTTRYLYGAFFIDHLARRYGPEALSDFVDAVGRRILPYRLDDVARRTFGTTATREWAIWRDSLEARYSAAADSVTAFGLTRVDTLTGPGRLARFPRYSPDGYRIAYSASTGRNHPAIRIVGPDGSDRVLARRPTTDPPAWMPDGRTILTSGLDYIDPYTLLYDIEIVGAEGEGRGVTTRGRVWEPDPHPDGTRAIAVANARGTNVLAIVHLATGRVQPLGIPSLDTYWSGPRWSPDGSRIAAARWGPGGQFDVVILDAEGTVLQEVTSDRAVDGDPAWSPDGRYVLFSSDRTGIPNLFAFDTREPSLWQVTNVLTGAFQPDVSPDGAWIAFSLYGAEGYRIARIPFDRAAWRPAPPLPPELAPVATDLAALEAEAGGPVVPYSPWRTLVPYGWGPVFFAPEDGSGFWGAGLSVEGSDVIERHAYRLEGVLYEGGRFGGLGAYTYRGWGNPALRIAGGQEWREFGEGSLADEARSFRREREGAAQLAWVARSWRSTLSLTAGADLAKIDIFGPVGMEGEGGDLHFPLDLGGSVGIGYSSVRAFAYSLGPQEGIAASTRVQARRYLDPPDWAPDERTYWRVTGRSAAYRALDWFGFAPPTLSFRLDGGIEMSDASAGFVLGGAGGTAALPSEIGTVSTSSYPVRGYPAGAQRGNRVASASAEYRFPLALVERGFRLLPVGLDRIWGDVFLDAGTAWCAGACGVPGQIPAPTQPNPLVSAGAEALFHLRLGYLSDLPLRFGAALPFHGEARFDPHFYFRIGRLF